MKYHLQSRRLYKLYKRRRVVTAGVGGALIFIFLLVAILRVGPPQFASRALHTLATPVWKLKSSATAQALNFLSFLQSKQGLIEENQTLKSELEEISIKLLDRNLLLEENQLLKELSGRVPSNTALIASVLTKPNSSPYDTFILDVGESQGVEVGDEVLVSGLILIGKIDQVFKNTSRTQLFSSPGVVTEVLLARSNITAVARGRGGGNFEITLPRGVDVKEGEEIVLPGVDLKIFGVVEKIFAQPADSFQTLLFKSPVNVAEINTVLIEKTSE